ncbi:MAG: 3'-5' exonuclease [Lutibacter sp.]|jgi:hypothetical protein|nr:3'-5' exonuclease [Lutibacter sp.]
MNIKPDFTNILFLDIETVPEVETYQDLPVYKQALFAEKTHYQRRDQYTPEAFYERAGIWAEFGKIVCISVGYFSGLAPAAFRIRSFYGNERSILQDFGALLQTHFSRPAQVLCAHNGKEFDFPYIARRMIIHQLALPEKLHLFGKKPWEVPHLDTMELWKFGDYKHYTSLKLLSDVLGIPSPKDDIDGSEVARVFYQAKDIDRIVAYCERDTLTVAQLLLRFCNKPLIQTSNIRYLTVAHG